VSGRGGVTTSCAVAQVVIAHAKSSKKFDFIMRHEIAA
jgi:hypothetical protein